MATNVQRGGLGFEKFFRRRSSSVEGSKDPEKSVKTSKDDAENSAKEEKETGTSKFGKYFGQIASEDKNESAGVRKTITKEIDEASSQKTNESKKSLKTKKPESTPENISGKAVDKREDSEACKEYVIKDDVGQVKLTEIINNSIKEAVLNIVKEGVGPLADSLDLRTKDITKKCPSSVSQETPDKENKPGSPKHQPSLPSGANKTFDSHLCQTQYQQSTQISSRNSWKLNDQNERVTVNQCIREVSPRVNKNRKVSKSKKQKDKSVREGSPKIGHQTKGQSSHFRTDNRRMTGNVNIYICSEANENPKEKPKDKKDCVDDSESAASSTLSISTSKLVAALKKKRRKNVEDEPLSCVCEIPESSVEQYGSESKIADNGDVSCLSEEDGAEIEFPDTQSTSSRDACICEDTKFSDLDFPGSDVGSHDQPYDSAASNEYTSFDNDLWPCINQHCPSYDGSRKCYNIKSGDNAEQNLKDRCSCCNLKKCKKDRPITAPCPRNWKSQPEQRKSRDKTCITSRDTQQFNKCLCVVEEEDEDCCNDRKESDEKFNVCGMPSTDEENVQNKKNEPEENPLGSHSDILKEETEKSDSPKVERKKSVRTSDIVSANSEVIPDKKDKVIVENDIDLKSEFPKPTLLTSMRKNFKRSSGKNNQDTKNSPETLKDEEQVENTNTEENQKNSVVSKDGDDNVPPIANEKRKSSFFFRSIKKAMDIVKIRKDDGVPVVEEDKSNKDPSPEFQSKPKINGDVETNGQEDEKDANDQSFNGIDTETFTLNSGVTLKQEKRSRSRISTAIASRRSPAATSNESSKVSISHGQTYKPSDGPTNDTANAEGYGQESQGCTCGNLFKRSDCCCKKPETPKNKTCKCYTKCKKTSSGTSVCCKKLENPRREICTCCSKCGNPVDKCICCSRTSDPIESDLCKCCPSCSKPIPECKCCCSNQETIDQELCNCCRRLKRLCCCDLEENSRANTSQLKKCCKPRDLQENARQCSICCSPKAECRCGQKNCNWECPKSMICIYCDKPQDNCICKAPIRKCSQCGLPLDVCNCKPLPCCDCSGRQIVQAEDNDRQTISVTAWKPRRNIRRYFARGQNDADGYSEEDCVCYEQFKPYGSDKLPYQKGTVFSDVMSELQHKMSGSVCCNVCRNVPCNCWCMETENKGERRPKQRLSTISERRSICPSQERSRSISPIESCRCATPHRKNRRKLPASNICDRCRTSPCRCRRSSASPQKKPSAKCYYCKSLPCICAPIAESANPRLFRKADSSQRRRKEFNSTEEHVNADVKNENNGHRGRESNHVVPCPGRQQPRKYSHRRNPPEQHTLNPRERVR